jgi:hypothetical protein
MSASIRFDNEKQVVRQVCERLLRWGYSLGNVSDGQELMGATATKNATMTEIVEWSSCAESGQILFYAPRTGKRCSLILIYGNSPQEVVADLSAQDEDTLTVFTEHVDSALELTGILGN